MEIYNGIVHGITDEGSGISVLRTFRLLRILKLVRFLPNLRRQLVVMLRTMDNVAVFFALLMLFIFIFRYVCGSEQPNRQVIENQPTNQPTNSNMLSNTDKFIQQTGRAGPGYESAKTRFVRSSCSN